MRKRVNEDGPIMLRKARVSVMGALHRLLIQHEDQLPGIQISPNEQEYIEEKETYRSFN